jgi:hypothetical protein
MTGKSDSKQEHKARRQGPLSLWPLSLEEALEAALNTPPPPKSERPKKDRTPKGKPQT